MVNWKYLVCVLLVSAAASASDKKTDEIIESAAEITESERMAFIDPETGKLVSPPASQVEEPLAKSGERSVGRGELGVASEPQLMPDGSRKIEFNGQFNKPLKASIGDDGAIEIGHDVELEN